MHPGRKVLSAGIGGYANQMEGCWWRMAGFISGMVGLVGSIVAHAGSIVGHARTYGNRCCGAWRTIVASIDLDSIAIAGLWVEAAWGSCPAWWGMARPRWLCCLCRVEDSQEKNRGWARKNFHRYLRVPKIPPRFTFVKQNVSPIPNDDSRNSFHSSKDIHTDKEQNQTNNCL